MTRETAADKALRILHEGRVIVIEVDPAKRVVRATVRGEGHLYRAAHTPAVGWHCSCLARSDGCSHLRALRRVVAVDLDQKETP